LSIGTKLVLGASEYGDDKKPSVAERRVVSFLKSHGFQLGEPEEDAQFWAVSAVNGGCYLRVAVVSPQGWHRQVVRRAAPPGSKVFFVIDGRIYQDQPVWRTRASFYWHRMNGLVGSHVATSLLLGVVASPDCDWLNGAWSELRE
jgi:hypothetical protein